MAVKIICVLLGGLMSECMAINYVAIVNEIMSRL